MERQIYEEKMKIYFERQQLLREEMVRLIRQQRSQVLIRQQRSQVLNHHTSKATSVDTDGSGPAANGEDKDVGELA